MLYSIKTVQMKKVDVNNGDNQRETVFSILAKMSVDVALCYVVLVEAMEPVFHLSLEIGRYFG